MNRGAGGIRFVFRSCGGGGGGGGGGGWWGGGGGARAKYVLFSGAAAGEGGRVRDEFAGAERAGRGATRAESREFGLRGADGLSFACKRAARVLSVAGEFGACANFDDARAVQGALE